MSIRKVGEASPGADVIGPTKRCLAHKSVGALAAMSALALLQSGSPALAQFDTTLLSSNKAWTVEHVVNTTSGGMWCEATTRNRAGQTFDLTTFDSGEVAVYVFDHSWSLAPRAVRFRIDIDSSVWTVDGSADGVSVSVRINDDDNAATFIGELGDGSAVAVYNESGARLATFSLQGSREALYSLAECWMRIQGTDPFGGASVNASDPF